MVRLFHWPRRLFQSKMEASGHGFSSNARRCFSISPMSTSLLYRIERKAYLVHWKRSFLMPFQATVVSILLIMCNISSALSVGVFSRSAYRQKLKRHSISHYKSCKLSLLMLGIMSMLSIIKLGLNTTFQCLVIELIQITLSNP
jgi:hypothetical protein